MIIPTWKTMAAATVLALATAATGAEPQPSISVSGRGEHAGSPDLAIIGFAVETTAPEAAQAMQDNARKSEKLSAALKGAIGSDDRISTSGYSLDPVYDHRRDRPPNEPPSITGYVARNEVRVETVKTDQVGGLIDLATQAGANRISGLQFTLKDQKAAKARALEKAAADAAQQAATIASALGVSLGKVLSAGTSVGEPPQPRQFYGAAMAMESRAATPIEPGDVRVEATVHVTYAIE